MKFLPDWLFIVALGEYVNCHACASCHSTDRSSHIDRSVARIEIRPFKGKTKMYSVKDACKNRGRSTNACFAYGLLHVTSKLQRRRASK